MTVFCHVWIGKSWVERPRPVLRLPQQWMKGFGRRRATNSIEDGVNGLPANESAITFWVTPVAASLIIICVIRVWESGIDVTQWWNEPLGHLKGHQSYDKLFFAC